MRRKIVAGNWKMNKTFAEAVEFIRQFNFLYEQIQLKDVIVIVAPGFPYLLELRKSLEFKNSVFTAGQNCYCEDKGAYTGEISAAMIRSVGADYVIIGHSERRIYFNENNSLLSKKLTRLCKAN